MSIAANCADGLSEKMSSTVGSSMAEVRGGGAVSWVITWVGAPGEHEEEPFFDVPAGVQAAGERGRVRHAHQLPACLWITACRSGERRHSVRRRLATRAGAPWKVGAMRVRSRCVRRRETPESPVPRVSFEAWAAHGSRRGKSRGAKRVS